MASSAAVIDYDYLAPAAAFADGGGDATTGIEDLPADVMSLMLRRLDGASLAALGCASSAFRDLAADPEAWRALCLAAWPSVRDAVHLLCNGDKGHGQYYRQLFADAFPFPALPPPAAPAAVAAHSVCLPERLVSAVDLHHGDTCIMSRVIDTDTSSAWFLGSPFRIDALVQEGFSTPSSAITPSELSLTWLLVDPSTGRAVNASSRRPVSVTRHWLTGETVARFALVLDSNVALDAAVTMRRAARARAGGEPTRGGRRGGRREWEGRVGRRGGGDGGRREEAGWARRGGGGEGEVRGVCEGEEGDEGEGGEEGRDD